MEKHRNDVNLEKYILVAVSYNNEDVDDSLNELEDLVKTASAITVGRIRVSLKRQSPCAGNSLKKPAYQENERERH